MDSRVRPVLIFGLWKLIGTVLVGLTIDPLITGWEGADALRTSEHPLRAFHNWDANHYISIATNGYVRPDERAFYPLFPMALRGFMTVFGDPALAGVVLTIGLSSLFAFVYYRFAGRLLLGRHASIALIAVIALPSAFFLHCIYTESLFLLLLFLFFWFFFEQSWLAGICAMLLPITRGQGIFVGFAVGLIFVCELPGIWRTKDWPRVAYLVGMGGCFGAGLLGFMAYQQYAYGNPLEFVDAQSTYYGGRFGMSLAHSFDPVHVLRLLFTLPADLNGPYHGLLDKLCIFASIALAPLVWRANRRLFAFYFCLSYFPATMAYGGAYLRYFLLPYSIAAIPLARAYVDRTEIFGVAKHYAAWIGLTIGFALQAALSLLYASYRWVG